MDSPELYRKAAFQQKRDAITHLKEFTSKKRWKVNARVIDIGCGDGSTNNEILQKILPDNFTKIVGCDISQNMVDYAKENYSGERIEFVQWDVTQEVPVHFQNAFDHAFSCYVLHWVKQQETAFLNIYNTLADGGNCLLMFLGKNTIFEVFRILSRTTKWREDLKDVEIFISPYQDSKDPKNEVENLMKTVGFQDVEVNVCKNTYTYDTEAENANCYFVPEETFKNFVKAVNPFKVLNERWDEFMSDYFEVAPDGATVVYHLIVAYGSK